MKCTLTLRVREYSGATNRAAHRTTARMVAVVVDLQAMIAARVRKHWDGRNPTGAHGRQSFGVKRGDEERKKSNRKELGKIIDRKAKSTRNSVANRGGLHDCAIAMLQLSRNVTVYVLEPNGRPNTTDGDEVRIMPTTPGLCCSRRSCALARVRSGDRVRVP